MSKPKPQPKFATRKVVHVTEQTFAKDFEKEVQMALDSGYHLHQAGIRIYNGVGNFYAIFFRTDRWYLSRFPIQRVLRE